MSVPKLARLAVCKPLLLPGRLGPDNPTSGSTRMRQPDFPPGHPLTRSVVGQSEAIAYSAADGTSNHADSRMSSLPNSVGRTA
jgi:hypothetical protein